MIMYVFLKVCLLEDSQECLQEYRLREPATLNDLSAIYRIQMILMFEWVEKLDEFQLIDSPHDKARLLRAFSMKYLLLDNIFHTMELNQIDRLVLVNNTFIEAGNLPQCFQQNFQDLSVEVHRAYAMFVCFDSFF